MSVVDPALRSRALAQCVALVALGAATGATAANRRPRLRALGGVVGAALTASVALPYAGAVARNEPYPPGPIGRRWWLLDSTWSAPNTLAGAVFLLHQRRRGNAEVPDRSRGSGSLWLSERAIPGYATTIGIVKAGSNDRVDAHEDVHVQQARLLGPLYLPLVGLDYVLATVLPFWLLDPDARAAIRRPSDFFIRGVYREVWHERWAYALQPVRTGR